jgi:hypothetical protein
MTLEPQPQTPETAESPNADWGDARPEIIPNPTAWPAGMAFGITLFIWGFVTSMVLIIVGLTVMTVSLVGWIGEMRHERR